MLHSLLTVRKVFCIAGHCLFLRHCPAGWTSGSTATLLLVSVHFRALCTHVVHILTNGLFAVVVVTLRHGTEPEAALTAAIINRYRSRTAVLFQPMEWIRTVVELAPYQYFVEWICWSATFGLMVRNIYILYLFAADLS